MLKEYVLIEYTVIVKTNKAIIILLIDPSNMEVYDYSIMSTVIT